MESELSVMDAVIMISLSGNVTNVAGITRVNMGHAFNSNYEPSFKNLISQSCSVLCISCHCYSQ